METWVFRLISVHCRSIGWGRAELGFILSLSAVFCSKLMLCVKDIETIVSQVLNRACCCILRGSSGKRIMDVVPGGMELEPHVKTGSRAGHTDLQ